MSVSLFLLAAWLVNGYVCIRVWEKKMSLSFGQAAEALAQQIDVHAEKMPKFKARLKQLQRLNFPPGVNVGKFAKAAYGPDAVFQMAFALELLQAGLTPERATASVVTWWSNLQRAIAQARRKERLIAAVLLPKDFGTLTSSTHENDRDEQIAAGSKGFLVIAASHLSAPESHDDLHEIIAQPRAIVINVSTIVDKLERSIANDPFWQEVDRWPATRAR